MDGTECAISRRSSEPANLASRCFRRNPRVPGSANLPPIDKGRRRLGVTESNLLRNGREQTATRAYLRTASGCMALPCNSAPLIIVLSGYRILIGRRQVRHVRIRVYKKPEPVLNTTGLVHACAALPCCSKQTYGHLLNWLNNLLAHNWKLNRQLYDALMDHPVASGAGFCAAWHQTREQGGPCRHLHKYRCSIDRFTPPPPT